MGLNQPSWGVFLISIVTIFGVLSSASAIPMRDEDVYLDVYGPRENWKKIFAADLYPNSTVEGQPINDTFVIGYSFPTTPQQEVRFQHHQKQKRAAHSLSTRGYATECFQNGYWLHSTNSHAERTHSVLKTH